MAVSAMSMISQCGKLAASRVVAQGMQHPRSFTEGFSMRTEPIRHTEQCFKKNEVSFDELKDLLAARAVRLIDVRDAKEVETGMIPSAVNIPVTKVKTALQMPRDEFKEAFGVRQPDPAGLGVGIVFYSCCAVKSATSLQVAHQLGFKKARHYTGGWDEWSMKHDGSQACDH